MGIIGSYIDRFHVAVERFEHRPGEVRLQLFRNEPTGWSTNNELWIESEMGDDEGDQMVTRVAQEMIDAAYARDARKVG